MMNDDVKAVVAVMRYLTSDGRDADNSYYLETLRLQDKIQELTIERERRFDCHGGPGTTNPACGGCTTCLLNKVSALEKQRDMAERWQHAVAEELNAIEPVSDCRVPLGLDETLAIIKKLKEKP